MCRRLKQMEKPRQALRVGIVRTYTTELLGPYWNFEALLAGFSLDLYQAPYGSLIEEAQSGSGLCKHQPDVVFFFMQWDDLDPRLTGAVTKFSGDERKQLVRSSTTRILEIVGGFRSHLTSLFVVSFLPRIFPRELGIYDAMAAGSETAFFADLKVCVAARLRQDATLVVLADLDDVVAEIGRQQMFDWRLWLTSRSPFSVVGSQAVVARLFTYAKLLKQPRAKCILLDADNTLWGGIVGEDGPSGITLGPEYPGSAYVAFQRRLGHFQQRGLLLGCAARTIPMTCWRFYEAIPIRFCASVILRPCG